MEDTDPSFRYRHEQVEKMLATGRPGRGRAPSSKRVAEMSLFGHQLFVSGRVDEARVVFEGLVEMEVPDAFPYTMLGTIYLALDAHDRALALFEAALAIDPRDLPARVYRGEIRLNHGKLKLALSDLRRVVEVGAKGDPFVERARRLIRLAGQLARRRRRP